MKTASNQLLVIFGASGDLTGRKLLPSLYELHVRRLLPERFCILGAARTEYSDDEYRAFEKVHIRESLKKKEVDEAELDSFLRRVFYLAFDSTNSAEYHKLKDRIHQLQQEQQLPDKIIYYLATPPVMYELIPTCLKENGMNVAGSEDGWRRVIVEKPFGTSLESAERLNKHLIHIFDEKEIYRIDHYLGKETVQNILVLRFSNGIFEPLWNRNYIDSIEISASETLGVENRGKYYDGAGALRDMIQNHLMQLMAFTAMESPSVFDPEPIRDEIVKVFRALRPYKTHDMDNLIVRGQYDGYREEKNVAPDSTTETYVAMKMFIDNWRWSDVPFYIFTGKKLPEKSSEIVVNFKSTPHQLFAGQCCHFADIIDIICAVNIIRNHIISRQNRLKFCDHIFRNAAKGEWYAAFLRICLQVQHDPFQITRANWSEIHRGFIRKCFHLDEQISFVHANLRVVMIFPNK